MGCKVKIQKVERPTNKSFSVSFPTTLADAIDLQKGEEMEWYIEDRNTFVLKRRAQADSFIDRSVAN